jgi:DNA-binding transcriptional LysR family regulator
VCALESRVGATLFIRTTRSGGLTEAGERFIARAKPGFEELVFLPEIIDWVNDYAQHVTVVAGSRGKPLK